MASARNPERVQDKVREAHFFLVEMANYERAFDTEKFLYCLSAFMSAFRTIAFRLYGVTENLNGSLAKNALRTQLHGHSDIRFLIERTNVELHEDGVVVFQRYHASVAPPETTRWGRDWGRRDERFCSRLGSRYSEAVVVRQPAGWQFAGSSKNLIELCHDGLEAMEGFIGQVLATNRQTQNKQGPLP
jgi:hypothetical protein